MHTTLKKQSNIIYIIRKKKLKYMNWWELPGVDTDTYYSGVLHGKQHICSFVDETAAKNCLSFLKKYKVLNNTYPNPYEKDISLSKKDNGDIYIDIDTIFSLKTRCLLNNIGLMGISTFEYTFCETFLDKKNVFNLTISGIDLLEEQELDNTTQIDHLNYLMELPH